MAVKPERHGGYKEVTYSFARWTLLKEYREKAAKIMATLESVHLQALAHGWRE
jgi:predicted nucleotidyltransferase